ncbi:MAG: DUF3060 domain-containing protein [Mycobacterium sp.]|nr:DUF3060 domain-containing protein [Mycobacterium sp.]
MKAHDGRNGRRIGWLVFALLVIVLAVSGWLIAADRLNQPLAGRPTTPPMLGGSGPIDATVTTPAVPPRATARPSDGNTVSGVDNVRTITCVDNTASVSGVHNTVTVHGHCNRVEVSGVENTVTIDDADAIEVSGIGNRVRFLSGTPELTDSGIDNTLERG